MELNIDKLKKDDEKDYFKLIKKLWNDIVDDEINAITKASYQNKDIVYVAKVKGQVVGFINTSIRHDYVEGSTKNQTGYIEGIYVEEPFRNNQIAKRMVHFAIDAFYSQGIIEVGSDVEIDNTDSMAFHEKIGFKDVGTIKHYLYQKK
jgi:aminoglycoside 6'-N-acetyltransferase I